MKMFNLVIAKLFLLSLLLNPFPSEADSERVNNFETLKCI